MTPKAMNNFGKAMLIGGLSVAIPCFTGFIGSILSHNHNYSISLVLGCNLGSLIALGSIPLLIVSNVKIRNAKEAKRKEKIYGYCPKCGKPRHKEDTFCSKCGTQLP